MVRATQEGDRAAFGLLVGRHQRAAIRIAAVTLGTAEGADDVAQEAFVKAHRAIGTFRHNASFTSWFFTIVANTARNSRRHQHRQSGLALRAAARAEPGDDGPDEIASGLLERERIVEAINRLSPDDRLILTYRWYEQLSEAEIAQALDCRRGTVKSKLHRAMGRLRTELEKTP